MSREWTEWTELYSWYEAQVKEIEQKKKFMDGIFGLGKRPADAPCHEEMDQRVKALAEQAAESDAEAIGSLVTAVLKAPADWKGPLYARMALVAAQRHMIPLIPRMNTADREALGAWYTAHWPKQERFPVQKEIIRLLGRKTAKGKGIG